MGLAAFINELHFRRHECETQLCGAFHLSPALNDVTTASLRTLEKLVFISPLALVRSFFSSFQMLFPLCLQ